jgi:tRNA pseudouridine13 synthase
MHGPERFPFEPPLAFGHLAAPGGRVGDSVEDFCVDEIPLYAAEGDGDHWYVQLEKRSMTTPQLIRAVATASGASERDIGRAGLKDRHAVTTQWLSVPVPKTAPPETWELPDGVRLCAATRHRNKLKP